MMFRNLFHWHTWSMWEDYAKTNIVQPGTGGIVGYSFFQKRKCHRCGLTQYKCDRIMANV